MKYDYFRLFRELNACIDRAISLMQMDILHDGKNVSLQKDVKDFADRAEKFCDELDQRWAQALDERFPEV